MKIYCSACGTELFGLIEDICLVPSEHYSVVYLTLDKGAIKKAVCDCPECGTTNIISLTPPE